MLIEARDGRLDEAAYEMVWVDGAWRINAVDLRAAPGLGARDPPTRLKSAATG